MATDCGTYCRSIAVLLLTIILFAKSSGEKRPKSSKKCPPGRFGPSCLSKCPNQCPTSCGEDGKCVDCLESGLKLPDCLSPCNKGFFGRNCKHRCTPACKDSDCSVKTGNCLECRAPGLALPKCSSLCPKGTYGAQCSRRCPLTCEDTCDPLDGHCTDCSHGVGAKCAVNCADRREAAICKLYCPSNCVGWCNSTDGQCNVCASGLKPPFCNETCDEGYYGRSCQKKCPVRCKNGTCDPVNGVCVGCLAGYVGKRCNGQCIAGLYGELCSLSCPETCVDKMCHFRNGSCLLCLPGYTGPLCDQFCPGGSFGPGCNLQCPENCGGVCDPMSGWCWKCKPGYRGPFCNATCDEGSFGEQCTNRCSEFCVREKCHHLSGACLQCGPRRTGTFCNEITSEPKANQFKMAVFIFLGLLSPVGLASLSMAVYKYKIKKVRDTINHRNRNLVTASVAKDRGAKPSPGLSGAHKDPKTSPKFPLNQEVNYKDAVFRNRALQFPKYFPKSPVYSNASKKIDIQREHSSARCTPINNEPVTSAGLGPLGANTSEPYTSSLENLRSAEGSRFSPSSHQTLEHRQELSCAVHRHKLDGISRRQWSAQSKNVESGRAITQTNDTKTYQLDTSSSYEFFTILKASYKEKNHTCQGEASGLATESTSNVSVRQNDPQTSGILSLSPISLSGNTSSQLEHSENKLVFSYSTSQKVDISSKPKVPSPHTITATSHTLISKVQGATSRSDTLESLDSNLDVQSACFVEDKYSMPSFSKGGEPAKGTSKDAGQTSSSLSGQTDPTESLVTSESKRDLYPVAYSPESSYANQRIISESELKNRRQHATSGALGADAKDSEQKNTTVADVLHQRPSKPHYIDPEAIPLHSVPSSEIVPNLTGEIEILQRHVSTLISPGPIQRTLNTEYAHLNGAAHGEIIRYNESSLVTNRGRDLDPGPATQARNPFGRKPLSRPASGPNLRTVSRLEMGVFSQSSPLGANTSDPFTSSLENVGSADGSRFSPVRQMLEHGQELSHEEQHDQQDRTTYRGVTSDTSARPHKRATKDKQKNNGHASELTFTEQTTKSLSKFAGASRSHTDERPRVGPPVPGRKMSFSSKFKSEKDIQNSVERTSSTAFSRPQTPAKMYVVHKCSPPRSIEDLSHIKRDRMSPSKRSLQNNHGSPSKQFSAANTSPFKRVSIPPSPKMQMPVGSSSATVSDTHPTLVSAKTSERDIIVSGTSFRSTDQLTHSPTSTIPATSTSHQPTPRSNSNIRNAEVAAATFCKGGTAKVLRCPTTRQLSPMYPSQTKSPDVAAPKPLPTPPPGGRKSLHRVGRAADASTSHGSTSTNTDNSGLSSL
ncbi:uncharacterized protein LOC101863876 [Aplysia californica]|uniref:Uncharacterized protein LOC101863876 n=1 Tax=Aplysia californica TaxID=6500 RepID=A0ABM0JE46_APLCA|nr:uncharacterized protein LOC101863876 [Aplysia californica]